MIFSLTNRVSKSVFCLLGMNNSRIPGRKTKQCALCLVSVQTLKSAHKSPVSCTLTAGATESCLLGCQELFSAEGGWLTQHSTAAQQPDNNASGDRNSREGTIGLITDLFFCAIQQGFLRVSLHGDEFDRHPRDSAEWFRKLTLADLHLCCVSREPSTLNCRKSLPIWGIKNTLPRLAGNPNC